MTQTPADSTQPNAAPAELQPDPAFGWTSYAEKINGRFAMIGFVALLLLELVTGESFWRWLGI